MNVDDETTSCPRGDGPVFRHVIANVYLARHTRGGFYHSLMDVTKSRPRNNGLCNVLVAWKISDQKGKRLTVSDKAGMFELGRRHREGQYLRH